MISSGYVYSKCCLVFLKQPVLSRIHVEEPFKMHLISSFFQRKINLSSIAVAKRKLILLKNVLFNPTVKLKL